MKLIPSSKCSLKFATGSRHSELKRVLFELSTGSKPVLVDADDIPILVASIPFEDLPLYLNVEIYSYEGYYGSTGSTGSGAKPGPTIGLVSKRKVWCSFIYKRLSEGVV